MKQPPTNLSSSPLRRNSKWWITMMFGIFFIALIVGIHAASGYKRMTKALYGVLNPCFFCTYCEIPDGDMITVENNPTNLTSSKLYPWKESPAVIYFVVSEALGNEPIEVAITFPIKETILVLSSDKRVTFKLRISDEYKSFGMRLTEVYVNGPLKNTVELGSSLNPSIKYLCDENSCSNAAIRVTNGYSWSSGGKDLQSQMANLIGKSYTSFVGCERGRFFKMAYDTKDGCEPLSGGIIAGIVLGVCIPVLACCCGVLLGLIRIGLSCLSNK